MCYAFVQVMTLLWVSHTKVQIQGQEKFISVFICSRPKDRLLLSNCGAHPRQLSPGDEELALLSMLSMVINCWWSYTKWCWLWGHFYLKEEGQSNKAISIFLKERMQTVSLDETGRGLKLPMSSSAGLFLWTIICHWAWDEMSFVLSLCMNFSLTAYEPYTPLYPHIIIYLNLFDCTCWPTIGYQIIWRSREVIGDMYTLKIIEVTQSECASFVFRTSLDI